MLLPWRRHRQGPASGRGCRRRHRSPTGRWPPTWTVPVPAPGCEVSFHTSRSPCPWAARRMVRGAADAHVRCPPRPIARSTLDVITDATDPDHPPERSGKRDALAHSVHRRVRGERALAGGNTSPARRRRLWPRGRSLPGRQRRPGLNRKLPPAMRPSRRWRNWRRWCAKFAAGSLGSATTCEEFRSRNATGYPGVPDATGRSSAVEFRHARGSGNDGPHGDYRNTRNAIPVEAGIHGAWRGKSSRGGWARMKPAFSAHPAD